MTMTASLNTNKTFALRNGAVKIEVSAFFRGMSYTQDAILALHKLQMAKVPMYQAAFVNGDTMDGVTRQTGEVSLDIITYAMPNGVDAMVEKIYATLLDTTTDSSVAGDSYLNDFDQYRKIQIAHRINDGERTEWVDADEAMAA